MFKAISHYQQTQAIKASIGDKAFKAMNSKWQRLSAKGFTKLSFADWYKAERKAQIAKVVDSWFKAA